MSIVLSLQGCMAAGKTTAANYIQTNAPYIRVCVEKNEDVIKKIKERQLNKNVYDDYIEIQKYWIENEIGRWKEAQKHKVSLMDFGAEEIEFYTLNYPLSIGANWDVESPLKAELSRLRDCMPDRILFLDASPEVLRQRKRKDTTRSREFFEYYLQHLLPLKKQWFSKKENVDFLDADILSPQEVGLKVKEWVDRQILCV